jgi:glutamate racemase
MLTQQSQRPIGVFDSGLGGASVLREALKALPHEDYIYYGDNLNAPYGDRDEKSITALTLKSIDALSARGCKAILVACNTATANCISTIRAQTKTPVISVEPAIKPACLGPGQGKVLMMATRATTKLKRYLALQQRMPAPERVVNVACPGLVDRIERGRFEADAFDDLFETYLSPYAGLEVDAIVLGCTHYIFIKGAFKRAAKRYLRGACTLFDGNVGTIQQLKHILEAQQLLNHHGGGQVTFLTSGDPAVYEPLFQKLLYLDLTG